MKVLSVPGPKDFENHESGVKQVVLNYAKYLPEFGIEITDDKNDSFDLIAAHAGSTGHQVDVAHLHGLYWTADYYASPWEYSANRNIVNAVRNAKIITVPSEWVAETVQRDLRVNPVVLPHGADIEDWTVREPKGYVLWNKNRNKDVCDPTPHIRLAQYNPHIKFVTTYMPEKGKQDFHNILVTGVVPHHIMKKYIEEALVYHSSTKETWGIGSTEAMSAGVPILGFAWGGNNEQVIHGETGYLAEPNNMDDLQRGLAYCIKHRSQLSKNAREHAKNFPWIKAVERVAKVYRDAATKENPEVAVIIPVFNYADVLERSVKSVLIQTYPAKEIIIVDDGSTDGRVREIGERLDSEFSNVRFISKPNGGVATARNAGIEESSTKYISCLDADDEMAPRFLEACVAKLESDRSLGIAYTKLYLVNEDKVSSWPAECDYDKHLTARGHDNLRGVNQVPTCNVFRKEAWRRAGGYRQRYAPLGAGAEDAELWARIMSIGYGAELATNASLFRYYTGGTITGARQRGITDMNLIEPFWLSSHPWAIDHQHPFASRATPAKKRVSHPVRQYDEPMATFIIPVGTGHEILVKEALESVESQTYRRWEAVVVWDSENEPTQQFLDGFPYIKLIKTGGSKGAGFARNRGAEIARAPFIVPLDADDRLSPKFLELCLSTWNEMEEEAIVYTDYINSAYTTKDDLENFNQSEVVKFTEETGEVLVRGRSADYNCERAQRQPDKELYHWSLVTCLIPKVWHEAIGGFDETMESFEDVLYHWRMARAGYCYVRLPQELILYRLYSGTRREKASIYTTTGREVAKAMLQYSKDVLKGVELMACKGCPGKSPVPINLNQEISRMNAEQKRMDDDDYVMCEYTHLNKGNHHVVGAVTRVNYGYFGGGQKRLIHKNDIAAQPHFFRPLTSSSGISKPKAPMKQLDAPAEIKNEGLPLETVQDIEVDITKPNVIEEPIKEITAELKDAPDVSSVDMVNLDVIPGVTPGILEEFERLGIKTPQDILDYPDLKEIKGIGPTKAPIIIEAILQNM